MILIFGLSHFFLIEKLFFWWHFCSCEPCEPLLKTRVSNIMMSFKAFDLKLAYLTL